MVIDLKNINNYVDKIHLRIEFKEVVSILIEKDHFLVSIDLKDAFYGYRTIRPGTIRPQTIHPKKLKN